MGYGKKLKGILKDKDVSVRQLALECNIPPTTIYSLIQRDASIRYDFALKISNALDIPVGSICDDLPNANLTSGDHSMIIDIDHQTANYFSARTLAIAKLFNKEEFTILDKLIREFYVLDDDSRDEIMKIIDMKHAKHDNPERIKNLDNL